MKQYDSRSKYIPYLGEKVMKKLRKIKDEDFHWSMVRDIVKKVRKAEKK